MYREEKCANDQGDYSNKNCEDLEIRKGRNYCLQGDLGPSCGKEVDRQFDKILVQNGAPEDPHLKELGNEFETLYMDQVDNKTKTECECAQPYQPYPIMEVHPESPYLRHNNKIDEQFNRVLDKNKVVDGHPIEELIIKFEALHVDHSDIEKFSNDFETLYTESFNKTMETQDNHVDPHHHHSITEDRKTRGDLQTSNELLQDEETKENVDIGIREVKPTRMLKD